MNEFLQTTKKIQKQSLILAIVGSVFIMPYNLVNGISVVIGAFIAYLYLWHLGFSINKISLDKKNLHSFLRLVLTLLCMVLICHYMNLSMLFLFLGFLTSQIALITLMFETIFRKRIGQN